MEDSKPKTEAGNPNESMRVIALANQKGGVGKSMICMLFASVAALGNYRTHIINTDPQYRIADWEENGRRNNLWNELVRVTDTHDLNEIIAIIDDDYDNNKADLVLIDTPGFLHAEMQDILSFADFVVAPLRLGEHDIEVSKSYHSWYQARAALLPEGHEAAPLAFVINAMPVNDPDRLTATHRG